MSRRLQYSEEQMKKALQAVADGMKVTTASKLYGVPRTTLLYKNIGVYPKERKIGPDTVLSKEEENLLVKWMLHVASLGFPVTKIQLLDSVEILIKKLHRPNAFTNGRPGRHWYEAFLRRHPEVTLRTSQNLTHSRSSVSEADIRNWFSTVEKYFQEKSLLNIFDDATRVFNCDESAFFLSPKENKVFVRKGEKTVYNFINNDEKECLTTLICGNARGMLAPPMVMFSFKRIPNHVVRNMPQEWAVGRSDNGWMTGESFYEYIANIFHPWLVKNNIQFPVALFVDGHSSHLTMALSDFCVENQIELVALFPNSTHIIQPMDVAVFRPLKSAWKTAVHNWRLENNGSRLKREHFGTILNKALEAINFSSILPNGFRACGLHPFTPDAINFEKVMKSPNQINEMEKKDTDLKSLREHLHFFEAQMSQETLTAFKNSSDVWTGNVNDTNLFYFWQKLTLKMQGKIFENEQNDGDVATVVLDPSGDDEWISQILGESEAIELLVFNNNNNEVSIEQQISIGEAMQDTTETEYNIHRTETEKKEGNYEPEKTRPREISPTMEHIAELVESSSADFSKVVEEITEIEGEKESDKDAIPNASIESSATKQVSAVPADVPSPFKSSLFWPEPKSNTPKSKPKLKLPSVATSESWRLFHKKKEEDKQKNQQEKEDRKRKREEKALEKAKKNIRTIPKQNVDNDKESDDEESDDDSNPEGPKSDFCASKITIGAYVVVCYDSVYYPGKVLTIDKDVKVKTMEKSGPAGWKWPVQEDVIWYSLGNIIEIIKEPVTKNKRGVFVVPEMRKYTK